MDGIAETVQAHEGEVIRLRRDFHRHPELGLQEFRTSTIVAEYLAKCGLTPRSCNQTGVGALLRGAAPGPTLLLRADMDGLPIQEESDAPYRSLNNGVMHACGHDAHTAMLLVAAKILSQHRDCLHGNIQFVFQPNEENVGALGMIDEGIMDEPRVDACMGIHVWSPLSTGTIGVKAGPVMAGMQHFRLVVKGKGGHTATPQSAIDPILVSAAIIQAVQAIQTRELDALYEPAVIMFGAISGGTAANIIPDQVELDGTIRYLYGGDENGTAGPLSRFRRVVRGICETYRADYELIFSYGHPTLVNDKELTESFTSGVLPKMRPPLQIEPTVTLAGDDFSEFALRAPGLYLFLGAGRPGQHNHPHHHPRFDIDESILKTGVELHVRTARHYLGDTNR